MPDIQVIEATAEHAWYIGEHMRAADIIEVEATGVTPIRAMLRGFKMSTMAKTALVDDVPACMFGVAPISVLAGIGSPWLLGTDDVFKMRVRFIRDSRRYVDEMLRSHRVLRNCVDVRNRLSIRWIEWLGFELMPAIPLGVNGELFHPFELIRAESKANV